MKDTIYFKHDINARTDPKLVNVQMKYGMVGVGIFWCIIEMLYENTGYLPLDYERMAFELRTEKEIIKSIIFDFELFKHKKNNFWSEAVLEQFEQRLQKSSKTSESVKKRWEKYERNTNVIRTNNKRIPKEKKIEEESIEEKKTEEENIVEEINNKEHEKVLSMEELSEEEDNFPF